MEKKAILLTTTADELVGDGEATRKFLSKAAVLTQFNSSGISEEIAAVNGSVKNDTDGLEAALEEGDGMVVVDLHTTDAGGLEQTLAEVLKVANRSTLVALAAGKRLYLHGLGIKRGAEIDREALAKDLVPTVCYIADKPIPATTTGAVLYQALKDPNLKLNEINKLKDGLARMETAMERESREPWDKHDCA